MMDTSNRITIDRALMDRIRNYLAAYRIALLEEIDKSTTFPAAREALKSELSDVNADIAQLMRIARGLE